MAVNMVTYIEQDQDQDADKITIADIPYKPALLNLPDIENRIVCFYGFRSTIDSMRHARRDAAQRGTDIWRIALSAKNSSDPRGSLEGLANEEAISLWRADRPLRDKIAETLRSRLKTQKHQGEPITHENVESLFSADPALFNVLWQDKDFKHINVFLWKGNYNCATQLGVIRERELIESIDVTT